MKKIVFSALLVCCLCSPCSAQSRLKTMLSMVKFVTNKLLNKLHRQLYPFARHKINTQNLRISREKFASVPIAQGSFPGRMTKLTNSDFFYDRTRFITNKDRVLVTMTAGAVSLVTIRECAELYFWHKLLEENSLNDNDKKNQEMQNLIFKNSAERGDCENIDFWNKFFEHERVRQYSIKTAAQHCSNKKLLYWVEEFIAAQKILDIQRNKPENIRNTELILAASEKIKRLEEKRQDVLASLSDKDKKIFDFLMEDRFVIQSDRLGKLSDVLPKDTACLQYLLVGETLIIYFVCRDSSVPFVTTINLKEKNLSAGKFLGQIEKNNSFIRNNNSNIKQIKQESANLYQLIWGTELEEAFDKLNIRKVIINASGFMRYFPFAALYDGKQFLAQKYQISNITGMDLHRFFKAASQRSMSKTKAVIFADPEGNLPACQLEGEAISKLFTNKTFYTGTKAEFNKFMTMLDGNFIHLATHAKLDPDNPGDSYISFANNQKWKYSDPTRLLVKNVDLIVLSACSTAVKPTNNGSEVESMAYQLLQKYSFDCVIASFWNVDDGATASFMVEYYQNIVKSIKKNGTLDRGGALRKAQLKLLKNPSTSHPYYWAAFNLFGDFR